jgi:hypothetical protein
MKYTRTTLAGLLTVLSAALLAVGCGESVAPERPTVQAPAHGPTLDVVGDQNNGTFGANGTAILKGFNPTNPHLGAAVVATFFWPGSTNIITSVTDHLTNGTPVGNTYSLVEYVTAGGISMATYVATNARNFPDPNPDQDHVLVVQANLSASIAAGGIMLSAYGGVYPTYAQGLGAHRSGSGSSTSQTTADPGAISAGAGALVYGVTLANGVAGLEPPPGFANVTNLSDTSMKADGEYAVPAASGVIDPQWTWFFDSPSSPRTWLATVLALNEAPTRLVFTVQPKSSLPCPMTIPTIEVGATDDRGNTVTAFNGSMTVAIKHNGGALVAGTLSGTKTVAAVDGVARFSNLCIDQPNLPGNGYTLTAAAPDVNLTVESAAFSIGAVN